MNKGSEVVIYDQFDREIARGTKTPNQLDRFMKQWVKLLSVLPFKPLRVTD